MGERGGGIGYKVREYAWIGKKRTSGVEQTKIIPKMEGERKLKEERIGVATMENEQKTKADWIVKQRS